MAKAKEQKRESKAEQLATYQRVGYMPKDEYQVFVELAKRVHLKIVETKMGEAIRVLCEGRKFYTEA